MSTTPPHLADPVLTTLREEDAVAFLDAVQRGFQEDVFEGALEEVREIAELDRAFGYRVGDRWVATCAAYSRRLTVPGGAAVPAGAVTVVTVHPPYRRRGLLTAMMAHQLADVHRRGEPLAVLWASEAAIYGRFGYGSATPRHRIRIDTLPLALTPGTDLGDGSVGEVDRDDFLPVARDLHARLLPHRVGALDRPGGWWDRTVVDSPKRRAGASETRFVLHWDGDGTPTGYARYRFKAQWDDAGMPSGEVRVVEADALTPAAYARLWRYLTDLDLARTLVRVDTPLDDPLHHHAANPRAVHARVGDGVHVRLVDVAAALAARRYRVDVDVVLGVRDGLLAHNDGRFRLRGGPTAAVVEPTEEAVDLELDVGDLATAYLGGPTLTALAAAGRVVERTPGALAAASLAFSGDRAPFCPDHF